LLGAALRLWQYWGNPSLWIDELALARNLIDRSPLELLTHPLGYGQAAPPGFLMLEKAILSLLGSGEFALRLLPFLAALAALPLFLLLARRVLTGPAVPVALTLFVLAPPLTLRGAEVKQYSTDVFVALTITLLAFRWLQSRTRGRAAGLALAMTLGPWISHPAVFVVGGCLVGLAVAARDQPGSDRRLLLVAGLPGLLSLLLAVWYAQRMVAPSHAMFLQSWDRGLMPWRVRGALRWLLEELPQPFRNSDYGLTPGAALLYAWLVPVGWFTLCREDRSAAALLAAPIVVTLAAAAARRYPFADRQVLFLVPLALLSIAAAIDRARGLLVRRGFALGGVAVIGLLWPAVSTTVAHRPVLRRQEARPLLTYLARHRRSGEPVYVYFTGWQAVFYYASRVGLDPVGISIGRCDAGRMATYRADLEHFAGAPRIWVFFVHEAASERRRILAHLDSIGVRQLALVIPQWPEEVRPGASLYAYDLRGAPPGLETATSPDANPRCAATGPLFPIPSKFLTPGTMP
jgi:hypothetical protein